MRLARHRAAPPSPVGTQRTSFVSACLLQTQNKKIQPSCDQILQICPTVPVVGVMSHHHHLTLDGTLHPHHCAQRDARPPRGARFLQGANGGHLFTRLCATSDVLALGSVLRRAPAAPSARPALTLPATRATKALTLLHDGTKLSISEAGGPTPSVRRQPHPFLAPHAPDVDPRRRHCCASVRQSHLVVISHPALHH